METSPKNGVAPGRGDCLGMKDHTVIACHECDLIHRLPLVCPGHVARCSRCNAVLVRPKSNSVERTLALSLTGLILFFIANAFPFLSFSLETEVRQTTLLSGVLTLYTQNQWAVAGLVLLTIFLIPLVQLSGLLYIFVPLYFGKTARRTPVVFRLIQKLQPWSMMEVFMLGILVSIVKLAKMAQVVPGISLYALLALIFVLAAIAASIDPHHLWLKWEQSQ